ncbi:MAG: hypothetical protein ACRYF4_12780 [Janthinobacterium lividum]
MSKASELNSYIARVQRTLRLRAGLRGAAIVLAVALVVTLVLVAYLNRRAFPVDSIGWARILLVGVTAAAAAFGLAWPLLRLSRQRAVRRVEAAFPALEDSLTTFHQRQAGNTDPFFELLAADTLRRTDGAPASSFAPAPLLLGMSFAGLVCLGALLWMILAAPGYLGYGASLLWTGAKKTTKPIYALMVTPGDTAVRRNSDQLITAELTNLHPDTVQIFAHFSSAGGWEPVAMQRQAGTGSRYGFVFTGLPETVEYYVSAGPLTSPHYKVRVVDLPSVKSVKVTYHYPKWTGLKTETADPAGDLRAIEGTQAELQIEMDRPLKDGNLTLDNGQTIHLTAVEGSRYTGTLPMNKDGSYHVAATDSGQSVRLSEDYFIATDKAEPPQIALDKPGRDYRASPIEEVTLHVKGSAQFGLRDMHLHYAVNGGADKDVPMLKQPGPRNADGSYTLRLEDFKLQAGDLVSVYATAKDGHAEAKTDISFIQADPFEREFSQSQQGGGGGGGGKAGDQTDISKREKELIGETWKQINNKGAADKTAKAQGDFLGGAQSKLRDQVMALSTRMNSRDLSSANEEFTTFEKDMQEAAKNMLPATEKLNSMRWQDALQSEQKALQALLRAEATFRQIQVAFGQQQGGGGGGSSSGRDLASLFDLELDTEKNQYETAKTSSPQEQKAKEVEDALAKLDALAKRQEELANKPKDPQQALQERWQQEMLRREAEQLQRQMEQLASEKQDGKNGQQGQSGQQSQSGQQGQSGPSGQQGSSGSQSASGSQGSAASQGRPSPSQTQSRQQANRSGSASDQRIEQALSRMKSAEDAMKRSGATGANSAEAQRQAAERLRQATGLMGGAQQDLAGNKMTGMSHEADRLQTEERAQAERIDQYTRDTRSQNFDADSYQAKVKQRNQLSADRQELSSSLSRLQRDMRESARQMAGSQPETSQKLRDALTEMDKSDLDNHVQRTADWLRSGINPNSNGTEKGIADGLAKLGQQLHAAQGTLGKGGAPGGRPVGPDTGQQTAALGQVERLRSQIEAMRGSGKAAGRNGQQSSVQQSAASSRAGQGQSRQPGSGQGQQPGQAGGKGQGQDQQAGSGQGSFSRGNDLGGGSSGPVRSGDLTRRGGGGNGDAFGNLNTGDNTYAQGGQRYGAKGTEGNPADTERTFQQSMRELQALRGMVKGDPEAAKEVAELSKQMQGLDPARFPGNPALVEQMHTDVLRAVDKLELQLQRAGVTEARTGRSYTVPAGYNDSVADYYRRLSRGR